jgi:hypothetical protein
MADPHRAETPPNDSNDADAAERTESPTVALEREILDPSTDLIRLQEIHEQLSGQNGASPDAYSADSLRTKSDKELEKLILDGSTPYEALEDILHIIQERREDKPFPPADE